MNPTIRVKLEQNLGSLKFMCYLARASSIGLLISACALYYQQPEPFMQLCICICVLMFALSWIGVTIIGLVVEFLLAVPLDLTPPIYRVAKVKELETLNDKPPGTVCVVEDNHTMYRFEGNVWKIVQTPDDNWYTQTSTQLGESLLKHN